MKKIIAITLLVVIMVITITACGGNRALQNTWVASSSSYRVSGSSSGNWLIEFNADGTTREVLGNTWIFNGTWETSGNTLTIRIPTELATDVYTFNISGSTLTLESNRGTTTFERWD